MNKFMQIVTEKLQIIPRFNSKSRLKMKNKEKENNRRVKMNQTSRKNLIRKAHGIRIYVSINSISKYSLK